jgi:EAL domain-containing protein (putative c-di-GMP-specific phosphodiesterase class I)
MPACDEVQGYYISRPMPAAAVVDCLDRMPVARTRTASTDD